jgi:hypothetical protein
LRYQWHQLFSEAETLGFLNQGQTSTYGAKCPHEDIGLMNGQLSANDEKPTLLAEIFNHVKQELDYDEDELAQSFL